MKMSFALKFRLPKVVYLTLFSEYLPDENNVLCFPSLRKPKTWKKLILPTVSVMRTAKALLNKQDPSIDVILIY